MFFSRQTAKPRERVGYFALRRVDEKKGVVL
jgi:hypothetical protein